MKGLFVIKAPFCQWIVNDILSLQPFFVYRKSCISAIPQQMNKFRLRKYGNYKGYLETVSGGFINQNCAFPPSFIPGEVAVNPILDFRCYVSLCSFIIRCCSEKMIPDEIGLVPLADMLMSVQQLSKNGRPRSWRTDNKNKHIFRCFSCHKFMSKKDLIATMFSK